MRKIKYLKKRKYTNKFLVIFDDESQIDCSQDLIFEHSLKIGIAVDDDLYDEIIKKQRGFDLKEVALNYASYKPRTVKQIRDKLKSKQFSEDDILIAIDFLNEFNYLDDLKFSREFIEQTLRKKPAGKVKLKNDLYQKGVEKEVIDQALTEFYPEDESFDLALQAADKKMRMLKTKPEVKQKRSLISFLQGRGFKWDVIKKVLEEYFEED